MTYSLEPNGNTVTVDYGVAADPPTGTPADPFVVRETENHVTNAVVTYNYNSQQKVSRVSGSGTTVQQDFGVDPVSWTPHLLGRRIPRWPNVPTPRSFVSS